jgi:hypothetical protein
MDNLLLNFIKNPNTSESNWNLALHYHNIGQTASAVSFYLRTAERTEDSLLQYECLIRASMCFDVQGSRNFTVKGLLQHAVSIQPDRPEAYYLLSKFYEKQTNEGHWNYSYMMASIGERTLNKIHSPLKTQVDYPGEFGILFQKAVSAWWCGLCDESRKLFEDLYLNHPLDNVHYISVFNNLKFLNSAFGTYVPFEIYTNKMYSNLIDKFYGSEEIIRNYSEAFQDMFVLTLTRGKQNGSYLEIGSGHPTYGNNTKLLEQIGWEGIGIDYNESLVKNYNLKRSNKCIYNNALEVDYIELIKNSFSDYVIEEKIIDYLQLDCDPPSVTFEILKKIPFDQFKFKIITYEHDLYCDESKSYQKLSTNFLMSKGYIKLVNNVSPDGVRFYEDWWVHPDLVSLNDLKINIFSLDSIKAKDIFIKP